MNEPLWCAVAVFFALDAILALSLFEWWVTHEDDDEDGARRLIEAIEPFRTVEPLDDEEEVAVSKFFDNLRRIHEQTVRMDP